MRAPFNILVYPFRKVAPGVFESAVGVSGGGEGAEAPLQAAVRETREELGVSAAVGDFVALDATEPIPASAYRDSPAWGEATYVIPQFPFGYAVGADEITLSHEHSQYRWHRYEEAIQLLRYNHTPLWELNARLSGLGPRGAPPPV